MPELSREPDSTGGTNQKKKNEKSTTNISFHQKQFNNCNTKQIHIN
jgi:hypothetical protein